jgi:hypothetical protein
MSDYWRNLLLDRKLHSPSEEIGLYAVLPPAISDRPEKLSDLSRQFRKGNSLATDHHPRFVAVEYLDATRPGVTVA